MAIEPVSPANGEARITDSNRIPMSSGQQKLSVPDIPGYHLHWMRGTPDRLQAALQGGYEFVDQSETRQTNLLLGGDATQSGNTDMGTRVSVIAGEEVGSDNQPVRLYLMKLKQEWHEQDMQSQEGKSERLRKTLLSGGMGQGKHEGDGDADSRYVGAQTSRNMFQPKPIRRN